MAQENVCVKDVGETPWYYTIYIIDESEAILVFGCFCLRPEKKNTVRSTVPWTFFTTPVCDKEYVITNAFFHASVIRLMTGLRVCGESSSHT